MAANSDPWVREYNEASRLADDISTMMSERGSLPQLGPDAIRHISAMRRKLTILSTRLDTLDSLLSKLPALKTITNKEMHRRQDMLANLRSKAKQMASALNMSTFANREELLGPSRKPADEVNRANDLDNQGIVILQRQIMREQDEGLEKLEETVINTKHIALAVNEELDLHTRLIDNLDEDVEITNSRLQRLQKRLVILNKRTKGGCSCMCLLLSVIAIVILVVIAWAIIKY
ncbi:syntaxin-52-like protein [Carex littledalei]|uniref:Syntaxin-52-like protein n=1 Tax=Carex littledalei TaxID=544730 RepID=A0A833VEV2_9POAL|nr:syntaxin-52-like protein [Carex littledalei]